MQLNFKKTSLIILGLTSIVGSRTFFALLNDPEGPNLLIVAVLAVLIYAVSWGIYRLLSSMNTLKRLLLVILIQIIIVSALYFFLS